MPIRFKDQNTKLGKIRGVLSDFTTSWLGTSQIPSPARTGTISAVMQNFVGAFVGFFSSAPNRTGTIARAMDNFTSVFLGSFTSPDLLAPTVPSGLFVLPVGPQALTLFWAPSRDVGSGVANYRVFRNGAFVNTVAAGPPMALVGGQQVQVTNGDTATKVGGVLAFDSEARSTTSVTGSAVLAFKASQLNAGIFGGINSDPATDPFITSIDYAWYCGEDGIARIHENGSFIGLFGAYTTATVFSIVYEGTTIRYFKDGVQQRSVLTTAGRTFFFDSSFQEPGGQLNSIAFGRLTFADTGLTPSTTYQYRVSAVDNATNESAQSPVSSGTTQAGGALPVWASGSASFGFTVGIPGFFDLRTLMAPSPPFVVGTHGVPINTNSLPPGVTLNANLYQLDYDGVGPATSVNVGFGDPVAFTDAEFARAISQHGERGTAAQTNVLPFPSMNFPSQARHDKGQWRPNGQGPLCFWDQTVKRSGIASLRQSIPSTDADTGSAQWRTGFVDTVTTAPFAFTAGQRFFYQRMFQCDPAFVNNRIPGKTGGFAFGPKNWILGHADHPGFNTTQGQGVGSESGNSMSQAVELACEWQNQANAPFMYHTNAGLTLGTGRDTNAAGTWVDSNGTQHKGAPFDFSMYNMIDRGAGVPNPQQRFNPTWFGVRETTGAAGSGAINPFTSSTGTFPKPSEYTYPGIEPGVWYCEMVEVILGALGTGPGIGWQQGTVSGFNNSTVRMWRAIAGQAPTLLLQATGCIRRASDASPGPGVGNWVDSEDGDDFGKIWMSVFCTNGGASARPIGNIYTDYIIVAAPPTVAAGGKPPEFPGGFQAPGAGT